MSIGEKIYRLRRNLDLTQEKLAKEIEVSAKTVIRWERGEREPSGDALRPLAAALGTSVAYLMGETDDPMRPQKLTDAGLDDVANASPPNPHHMALVKVLPKGLRACCGKGVYWLDESIEFESMINMPDPDLVRFSPVIAIWAEGDSMEPDIQDGDMVIFTDNIYERELAGNGDVVVVNYNGRMIIRGLITRGKNVTLRAFNREEYDDIKIDPENDDFDVLGRVLKIHRTWKPRSVY